MYHRPEAEAEARRGLAEARRCFGPANAVDPLAYIGVMREIQIPVTRPPGSSVSASVRGRGETVVVLGHGAGGNRQTPLLERFADSLARSGRRVVLFNYPYVEQGRRAPDPAATLEATSQVVAQYAREALGFSRSKTYQFIRLAGDLQRLPRLHEAVAEGRIGWTKAREVAKVATRRNETRWISEAQQSSRRELEPWSLT